MVVMVRRSCEVKIVYGMHEVSNRHKYKVSFLPFLVSHCVCLRVFSALA